MPNCFQLLERDTNTPASFADIDEQLCNHFNTPVDEKLYYRAWYDVVGLGLAMGKSFEQLREMLPEYIDIIDFLDAHYTTTAWYQHK